MLDLTEINTAIDPKVISDPFLKECITDIRIVYSTITSKPYWYGTVVFKSGNTKGEQSTGSCFDYPTVMIELNKIFAELKKKENIS